MNEQTPEEVAVEHKQDQSKVTPKSAKEFFSFEFKHLKWLLLTIGAIIILLLDFQLGAYVGFKKANYSFKWGDNYHKTFGGPNTGFFREFSGGDLISGYGTPGAIIKIDGNKLVVKSPEGEKIVIIDDKTTIRKGSEAIKVSDLKVGDQVVVIGSPIEDGSIHADIIRTFDQDAPMFMKIQGSARLTPFN